MYLYKYDIVNQLTLFNNTNLPSELDQYMTNRGIIKNRSMKSDDGDSEFFIVQRTLQNNILTGSFIHVLSNVTSLLSKELLQRENVDVSEIYEVNTNTSGTLKSISYFALSPHTLILSKKTSKNFISYINWILSGESSPTKLSAPIAFKEQETIKLGDIRQVVIKKGIKQHSPSILKTITNLFSDVKKIDDIQHDLIKSITISLDRNIVENKHLIDELIQTSTADLTFLTKKNEEISAGRMRVMEKYSIDKNANGTYCWSDLDQKLRNCITTI